MRVSSTVRANFGMGGEARCGQVDQLRRQQHAQQRDAEQHQGTAAWRRSRRRRVSPPLLVLVFGEDGHEGLQAQLKRRNSRAPAGWAWQSDDEGVVGHAGAPKMGDHRNLALKPRMRDSRVMPD